MRSIQFPRRGEKYTFAQIRKLPLRELACQMDLGWRYRRDLALPASHGMNM